MANIKAVEYPSRSIIETKLHRLIDDSNDWAQANGFVMRTREHADKSDICQVTPHTPLPSIFPRKIFEQAIKVQQHMNELYFRISWDYDFIRDAHQQVILTDEFTRQLMAIYTHVHEEKTAQPLTLLIQRADYMCHCEEENSASKYSLKQIEVNNIAASFGCLSELCSIMHSNQLRDTLHYDQHQISQVIPTNNSGDTAAIGIYQAWCTYGDKSSSAIVVVFVVEDVNQNQIDQRHVEYKLWKLSNNAIRVERLTLAQCDQQLQLCETTKILRLNDDEVGVVYFRAGYDPKHYHSSVEWSGRLKIERSKSIKSPWIGLQLANTKKIQQVLAKKGMVERFLSDEQSIAVRATFAGLWGLEHDSSDTEEIVANARDHPDMYVLKPQLEGGGGNYYGANISKKLTELDAKERAAYILMQRVRPLVIQNYLVRPFTQPELTNIVSELGVFGILFGNGTDCSIQTNNVCGHILRSKAEKCDEGGIAVGAAVVDSPFLVDD